MWSLLGICKMFSTSLETIVCITRQYYHYAIIYCFKMQWIISHSYKTQPKNGAILVKGLQIVKLKKDS